MLDPIDIYAGQDPCVIPAYSFAEAAHHLQLPTSTIRSWVLGRKYPASEGQRDFSPVIVAADAVHRTLSFQNLIELHVLSSIRRRHQIDLAAVRRALTFLAEQLGVDHPLANQQMLTDGTDLFIEQYGRLVNVSSHDQKVWKSYLDLYLKRIDRDPSGLPCRLFPFTRVKPTDSPSVISIDPRVKFGRPCINGTGIPTLAVAERYKAGDTIDALAADYGRPKAEIEEAIRFECCAA